MLVQVEKSKYFDMNSSANQLQLGILVFYFINMCFVYFICIFYLKTKDNVYHHRTWNWPHKFKSKMMNYY